MRLQRLQNSCNLKFIIIAGKIECYYDIENSILKWLETIRSSRSYLNIGFSAFEVLVSRECSNQKV